MVTLALSAGVTERRTMEDWAIFIQGLVDGKYAAAQRVILVMDNLNTHGIASLNEAFPADEAFRIAQRLENPPLCYFWGCPRCPPNSRRQH